MVLMKRRAVSMVLPWSCSSDGASLVAVAAQLFQAVLAVLQAARSFRDVLQLPAAQLDDDLVHVTRRALDGGLAWPAAEAAVAGPCPLIVVQRHGGDVLALDVLPHVQLGPIQQRMNAHVRARREVGLELVPALGRLIADVPGVVLVPRREVALLRAAPLL